MRIRPNVAGVMTRSKGRLVSIFGAALVGRISIAPTAGMWFSLKPSRLPLKSPCHLRKDGPWYQRAVDLKGVAEFQMMA